MSKTEVIKVRITADQRSRLEAVVRQSGIGDLSDHIRKALDEYIRRSDGGVSSDDPSSAAG